MKEEDLTCLRCGHSLFDQEKGCSCTCHFKEDRITPIWKP